MNMLEIRPHLAKDYQSLPDMDGTRVGVLSSDDRGCLDELGRFLVGCGKNQRFGVTLLHSHFEVTDGEVLVETADRNGRKLVISACAAPTWDDLSPITAQLLPQERGDRVSLIGLEYASRDTLCGAAPLNYADYDTLAGLGDILQQRQRLGRFGVRLLHDPLTLTDAELLLETCDIDSRRLDSAAALANDYRVVDAVETFWRWTLEPMVGSDGSEIAQVCRHRCVKACVIVDNRHIKGDHL